MTSHLAKLFDSLPESVQMVLIVIAVFLTMYGIKMFTGLNGWE